MLSSISRSRSFFDFCFGNAIGTTRSALLLLFSFFSSFSLRGGSQLAYCWTRWSRALAGPSSGFFDHSAAGGLPIMECEAIFHCWSSTDHLFSPSRTPFPSFLLCFGWKVLASALNLEPVQFFYTFWLFRRLSSGLNDFALPPRPGWGGPLRWIWRSGHCCRVALSSAPSLSF